MKIHSYLLKNNEGDLVSVLNYGARLHRWQTLVDGKQRDIVLALDDVEDYLNDGCYLGAIAGPYANRIKYAQINSEQLCAQLVANEGRNMLHGGNEALDKQFWKVKSQSDNFIGFTTTLADGYNGFPGAVSFEVDYLLEGSELIINLRASSEKTTVVGPTGHAYFNLCGQNSKVFEHSLMLNSEQMTPVDEQNIPTGEICNVHSTVFDFRKFKPLSALQDTSLDHNFMINENQDNLCAVLKSPANDLSLSVYTDYPAMQVYDGKYLVAPFRENQGICIEPQFPPNAPNQKGFPFEFTSPEKPFAKTIRYKLTK